jgi:RimJ/RimL family protein N-acetyltransferase
MSVEITSFSQISGDRMETERLILRPPVYSDAAGLYNLMSDPEVCRYSPYRPFTSVADIHFVIVGWREAQGLRTYIGAHRTDPRTPIGIIQVGPDEELAGSLSPRLAGDGLATEAIRAVIQGLGLRKAWTIIDAEHEALIITLAKVNIRKEKILPEYRVHPQISPEKRDCVLLRQGSN